MRKSTYTPPTVESLLARTIEEGDDCLIWQGYRTKKGNVPCVSYKHEDGRRTVIGVRGLLTSLLAERPIRKGYYRSTCGNALCINPAHTIYTSALQHSQHMARRAKAQPAKDAIRRQKIANAQRARIGVTDEQVHLIMHSNESTAAVARQIGVSKTTVSNYRRGKRHIGNTRMLFPGLVGFGARQ